MTPSRLRELHEAMLAAAEALASVRTMTPDRLRECLALLRWSQRGLADALGRPEGTVRQWARGAVRIPPEVAAWLEAAARWHERHPPPSR